MVSLLWGYKDIPLEELKTKYANESSQFIPMDGMDVHYRDEGNLNDSLPIVLIHGTGASLHTFDAWTEDLKKEYRVVRMDLPAYGLTGPLPDRQYSIANYVKFIEHFLAKKGIEKCILGGNSLGGQIAWQFTVKNPNIVEKLILIDAAGYTMKSKSVPIAFRAALVPGLNKLFTFITPPFLAKASVENVYADKSKVSEELANRYFELTLRAGNRQAFVDRMNMSREMNGSELIPTIQQPTLILWGAEDALITPETAYRFQEDLPNDTLVILENSGHVPMEESPEESLKAVLGFLK